MNIFGQRRGRSVVVVALNKLIVFVRCHGRRIYYYYYYLLLILNFDSAYILSLQAQQNRITRHYHE